MNRKYFHQVVKNSFGRKLAYYDADTIDKENVLKCLQQTMNIFNMNSLAANYLWEYYKGDQPALYRTKKVRSDINNKVVENHAFEIVMFKNGQTYGEPVTYVNTSDNDDISKFIDLLNDFCQKSSKDMYDLQCGEWQSATGIGYKAIFNKKGADEPIPFGFIIPTPLNTWIVRKQSTHERLVCFQQYEDNEGRTNFVAWTKSREIHIDDSGNITYDELHAYGDIPVVDYPNNQNCLSDIEIVISLLDAINSVQSNRVDSIDQFVQAFLKFVNCEIDENEFRKMKENGAIVVHSREGDDSGHADVDTLSLEMNQENGQTAKDDLWNNAMSILAIPNKEGNTGGDTQGAVELRNGWDFSKTRAMTKDAFVKNSEREFAKLILHRLKQVYGEAAFPISLMDFDVHIVHSPTDNLYTKSEALAMLLKNGIHPLVAIKTCGLWSDCEKVFVLSKPYLDNLYKTIDDAIEAQGLTEQVQEANELLASGGANG